MHDNYESKFIQYTDRGSFKDLNVAIIIVFFTQFKIYGL